MKDLLVYRQYDFHGIKVIVKIDRVLKKVSLVERKNDGQYKDKNWAFSQRELEYMNGWLNILSAMKYAITEAKKELEAFKEEDTQEFLNVMIALNDMELHDEDAK